MTEYKLEVTTGNLQHAGTWDHIYVTLFGTEGQSERTEMDNWGPDFSAGTTGTYILKTGSSLGKLLLVKVEKDPFLFLPEDEWYVSKIVVTTPEGDAMLFPCYRWISRGELVELRGGRAMKGFEEDHSLLIEHRKNELMLKKNFYQWKIMAEGLPNVSHFESKSDLPAEIRYSKSKQDEAEDSKKLIGIELMIKGLLGSKEKWESFEDLKKIFWYKKTTLSEYVAEHWKEDDFYGYQFLNGVNPTMIKRCSELPPNFPVTEDMVKPFLEEGSSLKKEMKKGNIFLYDQKKMDGITPRDNNGETLHVTACLGLFYMNPANKLMPIAIQLHQQPSEENPIFLPSDSETDWLLAKMFLKNADSMDHESVHHTLNTHFLADVFAVAVMRSFSVIHPLYKLLIPHFRYTLFVNIGARKIVLGPEGILRLCSLGHEGMTELMKRGFPETTYSSLCLPENITARGLESIPNFYYRDDGVKLWNIINSFVKAVVEHFYPSDSEVQKDTELQEWISEIFTHGFLGNKDSGIPADFHTVEEVIKFITMVIFTTTAGHAALHNGQYDYFSWVPNASLLLHKPPPTTKGQSSMETILEALPDVGDTALFLTLLWLFTDKYTDTVPLGAYPEERFDEPVLKQMMKGFQTELSYLSEAITQRNSQLDVPYTYLNPTQIENSITF
ncbi:hydroperoxide isomerase ALOXE3-like [Centropristis striata]|uniref:hydroperoxide isomerase ALOXE3-like n=1 Tax=Centropristis striata TaxID=184440 RepID=UPI0027DEE1BC|nr:hydroperoxide isomerase ALOXE3-like [Centropristis striata]XP_059213135.1 hydroperoxide isomerase ALOXE3-like [Centropristis striata]XP_059213136.1 hydroperoxide isomerase ALOXE3-like [Centropristis striata]